jgi:hypothetical protein
LCRRTGYRTLATGSEPTREEAKHAAENVWLEAFYRSQAPNQRLVDRARRPRGLSKARRRRFLIAQGKRDDR